MQYDQYAMRRRNAAPGDWTPALLPGLQLFLTADYGVFTDTARTTPATNGQAVGGWTDQSGTGHHATQAATGTLSPVLATGAFPSGKPALVFDGTNDYMTASGAAPAFGGVQTPVSAGILLNPTTLNASTYYTPWCVGQANGSNYDLHWPFMYGGVAHQINRRRGLSGGENQSVSHAVVPATGNQRQSWVFNGSANTLIINGGAPSVASFTTNVTGSLVLDVLTIGCRYQAGIPGHYLNGKIGVLVLCNQALSAANVALLDAWMKAWGGL